MKELKTASQGAPHWKHLERKETAMLGYGMLGTILVIVLIVWVVRRM